MIVTARRNAAMSEEKPEPGISPSADWREPAHYNPLLNGDRHYWAGEWLRRNPAFLADLREARCSPPDESGHILCDQDCRLARWGVRCCRIDGEAVFFWLPECNPLVLQVEAKPHVDPGSTFDCRQCPLFRAVVRGDDGQHLLFSDGTRHLQLAVIEGDALTGPALLSCTLCGLKDFETKPLPLQRLCRLARSGRLLKSLYPPERRARRWTLMLRAFDGAVFGASQRDIAAVLFGDRAVREDWEAGFLRTRIQRLLSGARTMVRGGYRRLLDPEEKGRPGR
ncbi:MAG: hypothetical protein CVT74_04145 [Alphaproteobacteria bacterium HGW-Alphaproteobacteria-13]|nr:MAG: hypothetical protein CVT74_04145 [Alphaproteobacteria bacterium HGW-Alphaproteobacteria-13]